MCVILCSGNACDGLDLSCLTGSCTPDNGIGICYCFGVASCQNTINCNGTSSCQRGTLPTSDTLVCDGETHVVMHIDSWNVYGIGKSSLFNSIIDDDIIMD